MEASHPPVSTDLVPNLRKSNAELINDTSTPLHEESEHINTSVTMLTDARKSAPVNDLVTPASVPERTSAKRRFSQSGITQQDIVVLHVAYVLHDSIDLQNLILEIVRVSEEADVCVVLLMILSRPPDNFSYLNVVSGDCQNSNIFHSGSCLIFGRDADV